MSNLGFLSDQPFIPDPSGGTVESPTSPRPVSGSRWRTCDVSTLYILKTVRMHVEFAFLSG